MTCSARSVKSCHGYDGGGKTEIGSGQYPRAAGAAIDGRLVDVGRRDFLSHSETASEIPACPPGNCRTGRFGNSLPTFVICRSVAPNCRAGPAGHGGEHTARPRTYAGSAACQKCHEEIYARWSKSRMANVVRDPRKHPDAIIPGSVEARSARQLFQGRHRVRLWQPLEAALLHQDRRRLFSGAGAVGRHAQEVAALFRAATVPTGGRRFIRRTISSVRPGRFATAAIQ